MLNNSTSCHCFAIFYTVVYCSFHIYNRAVNVHVNMVYFGNVDYVRYLSVSINIIKSTCIPKQGMARQMFFKLITSQDVNIK